MRNRKTWREKLADDKGLPKVAPIDCEKTRRWGEGTFVIPAPREVDAIMRAVPEGRLITIDEIRRVLAAKHGTTIACPLTTGIFAWIAAHAAEEGALAGETSTTPYWRTLKSGGELNPKFPGGIANLRARLEREGHTVISKGKRAFVEYYEQAIVDRKGRRRIAAGKPTARKRRVRPVSS